jgi:hypothetical protein
MAAIAESVLSSRDALPVCLFENPNRLVSLWEMITLLAEDLVAIWPSLTELQYGFGLGGEDAPDSNEVHRTLGLLKRFCAAVGWKELGRQTDRLFAKFAQNARGNAMEALAMDLRDAFSQKVRDVYLVVVEEKDSDLLKDAASCLCGSLHTDMAISEEEFNFAGRALAVGLGTACVSHAMRSVESSLHVLCKVLGVTFPGTVELQDWKNLTDKIRSQISVLEQQPRSPQKTGQLKQLSELMIPADGFRLAWRNHVAHAREKYGEDEARTILGHVAEFLKRLSAAL